MVKVGVGVVGCGGNGRRHAELYKAMDETELIGVYDLIPEAAQLVARRHGVKAFADIEELVNDDRVQAINAVNSGSHAPPVVAAANAGKHALVEVPFAVTVEECDRMIEATEKAGVNLMYAQTHRYYPVQRQDQEHDRRRGDRRRDLGHLHAHQQRRPQVEQVAPLEGDRRGHAHLRGPALYRPATVAGRQRLRHGHGHRDGTLRLRRRRRGRYHRRLYVQERRLRRAHRREVRPRRDRTRTGGSAGPRA